MLQKQLKTTVVALALSMGSISLYAQGPTDMDKGPHGKNRMEKLEKELKLTPEQKEKIAAIMEESKSKQVALHKQMMENREATEKQIDAILSPEQKAKKDQMKKEHGEKKMAMRSEKMLAKIKSATTLNATQEEKVKELITKHLYNVQQIKTNKTTSADMDKKELMKVEREAFKTKLQEVLEPSQWDAVKASLKHEGKGKQGKGKTDRKKKSSPKE